jgi:hypothetical protein
MGEGCGLGGWPPLNGNGKTKGALSGTCRTTKVCLGLPALTKALAPLPLTRLAARTLLPIHDQVLLRSDIPLVHAVHTHFP